MSTEEFEGTEIDKNGELDDTLPLDDEDDSLERTEKEPECMINISTPSLLVTIPGKETSPSEAWTKALVSLSKGNINDAYNVVLDEGDDLYLLRLMMKTGPTTYSRIQDSTAARLFKKVVSITKEQFLDSIVLDFFFEACEADLVEFLDAETKELMLMALETMKSGQTPDGKNNKVIDILYLFLKQHIKS